MNLSDLFCGLQCVYPNLDQWKSQYIPTVFVDRISTDPTNLLLYEVLWITLHLCVIYHRSYNKPLTFITINIRLCLHHSSVWTNSKQTRTRDIRETPETFNSFNTSLNNSPTNVFTTSVMRNNIPNG